MRGHEPPRPLSSLLATRFASQILYFHWLLLNCSAPPVRIMFFIRPTTPYMALHHPSLALQLPTTDLRSDVLPKHHHCHTLSRDHTSILAPCFSISRAGLSGRFIVSYSLVLRAFHSDFVAFLHLSRAATQRIGLAITPPITDITILIVSGETLAASP